MLSIFLSLLFSATVRPVDGAGVPPPHPTITTAPQLGDIALFPRVGVDTCAYLEANTADPLTCRSSASCAVIDGLGACCTTAPCYPYTTCFDYGTWETATARLNSYYGYDRWAGCDSEAQICATAIVADAQIDISQYVCAEQAGTYTYYVSPSGAGSGQVSATKVTTVSPTTTRISPDTDIPPKKATTEPTSIPSSNSDSSNLRGTSGAGGLHYDRWLTGTIFVGLAVGFLAFV